MLARAQQLQHLWNHFGTDWLAFRLRYAASLRTGAVRRRSPAASWDELRLRDLLENESLAEPETYANYRLAEAPRFFFSCGDRQDFKDRLALYDTADKETLGLCEEIASGSLRYFQTTAVRTGFPPDWHADPFTGKRLREDTHWSEIGDFENGDIRIIWEPSRFAFAFTLVRGFWRTGDERFAELFWLALEDWRDRNRPQLGANWKCGQETSLRVIAWCFALYGLATARATTAARLATLAQMIAVSGRRIEANIEYALSQRNNHGISEATGLFTIGVLFPELKDAARWRSLGRENLERQARELIYEDGSFSQHSVNYHRLMLHDYLWSARLADLNGQSFSEELRDRLRLAGEFLYQIQDEITGEAPCYGQNDGSLILPLTNCRFADLRPVIQNASYYSTGNRRCEPGPWDEEILWLFGSDALEAPVEKPERDDFRGESGGYYTLRSKNGFAFVRAATFRDRPSQADVLHVDLWWRGINVALDPGTYSYNAPDPWDNSLAHTAYHNTVTIDGRDQMDRAGRFLWLPWLHSRVRSFRKSASGNLAYWEGEHDGYQRLKNPASHRRAVVRIGDEHWLIADKLDSRASHLFRLQWLLADCEFEWDDPARRITLRTSAGDYRVGFAGLGSPAEISVVQADPSSPRGWRAATYSHRAPAVSMGVEARASSQTFFTVLGPQNCELLVQPTKLRIRGDDWVSDIELGVTQEASVVKSVVLSGAVEDLLELT